MTIRTFFIIIVVYTLFLLAVSIYAESPFRSEIIISSPYLSTTGKGGERRNDLHRGLDCHPKWVSEEDKDWIIFPIMDGEVVQVDINPIDGKFVLMKDKSDLFVKYCHAETIYDYYRVGDFLTTANYIMLMGKTGYTDGNHLHIEVYRIILGKKVYYNPENYFRERDRRITGETE